MSKWRQFMSMLCFCLVSCKIQRWGRNSLYIEKRCCSKMAQAFFPQKTFCFAEMTSWGFKIGLEGSFQRSCYEPGSPILKTKDVIEAKLKVWGGKNDCAFRTTLLRKANSPRCIILQETMQNIIFLPFEKVFKIKPVWKAHSRNPGKKVVKKLFFPTWLWSDFGKIKKRKERSFINWNEHRETKNARIGTKTVLRVKNACWFYDKQHL